MRKLILLLVFGLIGCAPAPAVISNISDSSLEIQTGLGTTPEMLRAKAREGCGIYGKTPVSISHRCLDDYCLRKTILFACK